MGGKRRERKEGRGGERSRVKPDEVMRTPRVYACVCVLRFTEKTET